MLLISSLLVVAVALVVVALASNSSKMARAKCPCYGDTSMMVCDDTSFTFIPDCVSENITRLSIRTPTIPLVTETIRRFTNLKSVEIAYIDDPQISKTFLSGHPSIFEFQIYLTSLDYVDNEWFVHAPSITTVSLKYNKVASLASDTFSTLPRLKVVSLVYNELTTLPPSLFEATALERLALDGNPWHCDCELTKFMHWIKENEVKVDDGASCRYPLELRGLHLTKLTPDLGCQK